MANPLTVANFAFTSSSYPNIFHISDQTFSNRTVAGFDPTLRAPYTINYDIGIQRELWRNTVLEARYVGNQAHLVWRTSNLNEVDIFNNGFLQEFKNAQINLAARGGTSFAPGCTGCVPLPIFDAAFGARGGLGAIAVGSGTRAMQYGSQHFVMEENSGRLPRGGGAIERARQRDRAAIRRRRTQSQRRGLSSEDRSDLRHQQIALQPAIRPTWVKCYPIVT